MKFFALFVAAIISLTGCNISVSTSGKNNLPQSTSGSKEQQLDAEAAARGYLALIDQKQYEKTWDLAGPALKAQTNEFLWVNTLKLTRNTFSISNNRTLDGFGFSTKIDPSVPVGSYVLVQFKEVSGGITTTEKVVMQNDQSKWKIIGYFIVKKGQLNAST